MFVGSKNGEHQCNRMEILSNDNEFFDLTHSVSIELQRTVPGTRDGNYNTENDVPW